MNTRSAVLAPARWTLRTVSASATAVLDFWNVETTVLCGDVWLYGWRWSVEAEREGGRAYVRVC